MFWHYESVDQELRFVHLLGSLDIDVERTSYVDVVYKACGVRIRDLETDGCETLVLVDEARTLSAIQRCGLRLKQGRR